MAKESAKVVMPIITVGSVDDAHAFYTDKLRFSRVMGALGEGGKAHLRHHGPQRREDHVRPRPESVPSGPAAAQGEIA